ncbi:MAG: histidine phosphatase family protein [Synechococcus sp.]
MHHLTKLWTGIGTFAVVCAGLAQVPHVLEAQAAEEVLAEDRPIEFVENANAETWIAEGGEGGEGDAFEDILSGTDLRDALLDGGHVIYFRHASTEKDYADQADPNIELSDCSTQRTLSEYGWNQSLTIRDAFQEMDIPVGEVISSEYCRAWQTAQLAFDTYEKTSDLNFFPAEEYTDEQFAQMRDAVMPYLTEPVEAGTNRVLVGHDDVFESAAGIYPEPQGIAYILTPDGNGGFTLVANMNPEDWALMAGL